MADSQSAEEVVVVQAYISRARIESFSLIADLNYISQNAPRICRALFEICLRKGWYVVADQLLTFSKVSQRCKMVPHKKTSCVPSELKELREARD